jgi:hypothetical protein
VGGFIIFIAKMVEGKVPQVPLIITIVTFSTLLTGMFVLNFLLFSSLFQVGLLNHFPVVPSDLWW